MKNARWYLLGAVTLLLTALPPLWSHAQLNPGSNLTNPTINGTGTFVGANGSTLTVAGPRTLDGTAVLTNNDPTGSITAVSAGGTKGKPRKAAALPKRAVHTFRLLSQP